MKRKVPTFLSNLGFGLVLLTHISFYTSAQPLLGTYTIGGVSPDFVSFTSAVSSLNTYGVAGPVTFNVRTGIYNEQIKINDYPGASSLNSVVFQSETGDVNDVILKHTHTSTATSSNYTVYLNGAKHITFKNLTIKAEKLTPSSSDKNRVLYITNHSDSVHFSGNKIISWRTESGFIDYNACILVGSDNSIGVRNDWVSFTNNEIIGGYTGLKVEASSSSISKSPLILNNEFSSQGIYGIFIDWTENPKVIGNELRTDWIAANYIGIELNNTTDSILVERNFLDIQGGSTTGIVVQNSEDSETDSRLIANNMINIGPAITSSNTPRGIRTVNNDTIVVAYNSVNIHQPTTNGYAFQSYDNSHVKLLNNQLIHHGGGLCYLADNITGNFESNNNNLYNNSGVICTVGSTNYSSQPALFLGEGVDEFSIQVDPIFMQDSILVPFNSLCYDSGVPVNQVLTDFYGTLRSFTSPDIGCFEGSLSDNDAGIEGYNLVDVYLCPNDTFPVTVDIKNFGLADLTSVEIFAGTSDSIYFSFPWSGNLSQFEIAYGVQVGYLQPTTNDTLEFKIWCNNPNSLSDGMPMNDTAYISILTAMQGTYTIGNDSSDNFVNFTEAVNALSTLGVCGPVLIIADSGVYNEQFIIPSIAGTSYLNTVTFQSENLDSTDVKIEFDAYSSNSNYVVQLNNSSYIIFKHIRIRPLDGAYNCGLKLGYGASNNTFSHCWFITSTTGGISEKSLIFFDGLDNDPLDSNQFINNRIENGGLQVNLSCDPDNPSTGTVFTGNYFAGNAAIAINAVGLKNVLINDNTIVGTRNALSGVSGVFIDESTGNLVIDKNKIHLSCPSSSVILKIQDYAPALGESGLITNNFLSATSTTNVRCLGLYTSSNVQLLNNSFKNSGSPTSVIELGTVLNIDLYNNIFDAENGASCYLVAATNMEEIHSDYNVFYTTSGSDSIIRFQNLPVILYYSFDTWQTISSGEDIHSVFTDPQFTSASDLHIVNASAINDIGNAVVGMLTDIDNELRDPAFPDPGADEFEIDSATYHDIELLSIIHPNNLQCSPNDSLMIRVVNHSIFAIDSFVVRWSLFGATKDSVNIIQNFMPGDTQEVYVGELNFIQKTAYDIKFEILLPNDQPDNYTENNSQSILFAFIETVEIRAFKDPCNDYYELIIPNFPVDSILWSTGSTLNNIGVATPAIYSVSVFKNGCETTAFYLLE